MECLNPLAVRLQNAWFAARDEEGGQTLVEYALILALVAIASIAAVGFFSGKLSGLFSDVGSSVGNTIK